MEILGKIKDTNYYQVSGWMINRLGLKGAGLNIFAIVYGFSQDGESEFTGSRQYLADFINATKPTVDKALNELCEKGYIIKTPRIINNVTFNTYKANLEVVKNLCEGSKESLPPSKETLVGGSKESLSGGSKETLHNNKSFNNNTINNKEDKGRVYGTFNNVRLSAAEFEKLQLEYPNYLEAIEYFSEYLESSGKKYKSHYLALKRWVFDALKEKEIKQLEIEQRAKRAEKIAKEQKLTELKEFYSGGYEKREYTPDQLNGISYNLDDLDNI